jgi:TPR repeat protein
VQLDSDEMTRLIKRGKDFLAQGNFASARLLFKRAADAGSAEAALALGSTYDPSVIKQLGAVSITPDIDGALKWYKTAADRGSAEAANLFANLMRLRKAAMAAKPTAAKPRSETEPVEEKANSRTITEPEVPPSTQPLATPGPVPKKEPTTIGGKAESQATGQPAETSDPVLIKATTGIGGKAEGPATGQPSETSDPVLKKAKIMVAAKMEDPTYAEFVDMKRVMRKNSFGEPFEIICGHVKGKMESGEATGDRPFLYLVKEDEAFIVGGNPASLAAIVYRGHCISANSR